MMKQEFEMMVGAELSAADYEIVEVVYMHYSEKVNKDTVAAMYAAAGMMIFRDLYPREADPRPDRRTRTPGPRNGLYQERR